MIRGVLVVIALVLLLGGMSSCAARLDQAIEGEVLFGSLYVLEARSGKCLRLEPHSNGRITIYLARPEACRREGG